MKAWTALLADFERDHDWAKQLGEVLATSGEPRFEVRLEKADKCNFALSAKALHVQVAAFSPALTFLIFDKVPEAAFLGELLAPFREQSRGRLGIVVAPAQSPLELLEAFHRGADDVWLPPLRAVEVLARASHALEGAPPEEDGAIQKFKERRSLDEFIGQSPTLLAELEKIPAIARCNVSVLIRGETGTDKEICTRVIHNLSPRSGSPFIPVNCGALPTDLVENELFGHEAGAFTSANKAAGGLIEQADGGTLLLDEIDSLPLSAQVKLLRFLQDKEYRLLGSRKVRTADLRILASSNTDLEAAVLSGTFRRDLYYRLAVAEITLPPLRERGGDILLLAEDFLKSACAETSKPARRLSYAARAKLSCHFWPGNVRELQNVITRAAAQSRHVVLEEADIVLRLLDHKANGTFGELQLAKKGLEKAFLADLLRSHGDNVSRAARAAGKERHWFLRVLQKHGLRPRQ